MSSWKDIDLTDADEETRNRRRAEKEAVKQAGLVKRKVGIYVGYVGTNYSGLQFSALDHVQTIEAELAKALFRAGCISEANSVSLEKVVAMKCLIDEQVFDVDPEGLDLARYVSSFLPSDIRLFSIQRVNDGFFARKACISRHYCYYLPFSLITGTTERLGEEEERKYLNRFRTALNMLSGRHPFHNYTKRKIYIESADTWSYGRKEREKRYHSKAAPIEEEQGEEEEEESDSDLLEGTQSSRNSRDDYQTLVAREKETGRWRFWSIEFKEMDDQSDRIVPQHYRDILSFTADDPVEVVKDGVLAVCCHVHGLSFMLHQIRYMIGASVAFARNLISPLVMEASLKACIRVNLPLALPQTLILYANDFFEFPANRGETATVARWSGNRLELRDGGRACQQEFLDEQLMPNIDQLLRQPSWQNWSENLNLVRYDETEIPEVREVMDQYKAWVEEKRTAKKAKQEALMKELEERGIDHETWKEERRNKLRSSSSRNKTRRLVKPNPNPVRRSM